MEKCGMSFEGMEIHDDINFVKYSIENN